MMSSNQLSFTSLFAKGFISLVISLALSNPSKSQQARPCDRLATPETKSLFNNLNALKNKGTLLGHHDDLAYGVGWRALPNRSDIQGVSGDFPALYGWDLSGVELEHERDINGILFKDQLEYIKTVYKRGGVNTYCWHLANPVNEKNAWDTSLHTVKQILPGAPFHEKYTLYLDRIAAQLQKCIGPTGEAIPILFRPFHELTGTWFWWCRNTCTPEEFKKLWIYTIDYLRNQKNLHNLLVVYSVSDFHSESELMDRYPDDEYVDVIAFDTYCNAGKSEDFKQSLGRQLELATRTAEKHKKLVAIAETGFEGIPETNWWTHILQPEIEQFKPAYFMLWRNANTHHFYAPYPGQASAADFVKFSKTNFMLLQKKTENRWLYR